MVGTYFKSIRNNSVIYFAGREKIVVGNQF